MNEFVRRNDDLRSPHKIMVHDLVIRDFIFKAIDLERELKHTQKSAGLLLKAITDNCDKKTINKIIDGHLNLMETNPDQP